MQLTGPVPKIGLNPQMREQKAHDQVSTMIVDALATDPAFQVRTCDGRQWICPYSGTMVACAADSLQEARDFLFGRKPWLARRGGKARPLFAVAEQKWLHELTTTTDERLRRFDAQGRWVNPFTGTATLLPRARAAGDAQAVAEIARALAGCAEAHVGRLS